MQCEASECATTPRRLATGYFTTVWYTRSPVAHQEGAADMLHVQMRLWRLGSAAACMLAL